MARLDPANADIRHFQGRLLALQKRYAPAIEKFGEAIALDAGNRWFLVSKAGAQADAGDLAGACAARRPCANAFPTGASATTCGPLCWTAWTARPKRWPRMSAPSPRTRQRADAGQPGHAVAPAGPRWPTHATRSTPRCGCNRTMRGRKPSWTACPRALASSGRRQANSQLRPAAAPHRRSMKPRISSAMGTMASSISTIASGRVEPKPTWKNA